MMMLFQNDFNGVDICLYYLFFEGKGHFKNNKSFSYHFLCLLAFDTTYDSITICKDTLFTIFLFNCDAFGIVRMFENPQKFYRRKRNLAGIIIVFILQGLMRNNGLYSLLLLFLISLFFGKNARKYVCISYLIPILFLRSCYAEKCF